jgi:hypothetical protein
MVRFKALRIHQAGKGTVARFDQITLDELDAGGARGRSVVRIADL